VAASRTPTSPAASKSGRIAGRDDEDRVSTMRFT
jgi:hypothetical protein